MRRTRVQTNGKGLKWHGKSALITIGLLSNNEIELAGARLIRAK
jgi:hypothetical protein